MDHSNAPATTSYAGVAPDPGAAVHDQPILYGALVAVILALASAITVLWRRSERRYQRELDTAKTAAEAAAKAGEAAREREVKRTDDLAKLLAAERLAFHDALEGQRLEFAKVMDGAIDKFTAAIDRQRTDHTASLERQRAEHGTLIRDLFDRKAAEDRTRDAKAEEMIRALSTVIDAANRRIARRQ